MREIILAIASLAGAAMLTALAVILPPESLVWRWILSVSAVIFFICAVVLLVDFSRRRWSVGIEKNIKGRVQSIAAILFLIVIFSGGGWFIWNLPPPIRKPPPATVEAPPVRSALLHQWTDRADRTHLRGIFRNISRVLKDDISPVQAEIPRLIEVIHAGLGHPLATQSLDQLALDQGRLGAARALFQQSYIVGSKYSDEVWDALEDNADLYDVSTSLNRYIQIIRGMQETDQPERYLSLLPDPESRLRDANFKLGIWVEDCLRRTKSKQDAIGD